MKTSSKIMSGIAGLFFLSAIGQVAAHELISPLEDKLRGPVDENREAYFQIVVDEYDVEHSFYDNGIWSAQLTEIYTNRTDGTICEQTSVYKHIFGIPAYTARSFDCE